MNTVVMVLSVALADAVGDLWRLLRGGPVAVRDLVARLIRQALVRALAVAAWLATTASLTARWIADVGVGPAQLIPVLAAGLAPLLLSGLELAPHIGPALYAALHLWVIVRLAGRLQEMYAVSTTESAVAVMSGAVGFWLVRSLSGVRHRSRPPAIAGGLPCP